jgi:ubiquitin fusion degradation protein 1
MLESEVKVPVALNLPFGQLFFGFNVTEYTPPSPPPGSPELESRVCLPTHLLFFLPDSFSKSPQSFGGAGHTLNGRTLSTSQPSSSSSKGKQKEKESTHDWGHSGHALGWKNVAVGAGGASIPRLPSRKRREESSERSPTPDFGVDDDEDVIMISDDDE